jgi:hypothetical protein
MVICEFSSLSIGFKMDVDNTKKVELVEMVVYPTTEKALNII